MSDDEESGPDLSVGVDAAQVGETGLLGGTCEGKPVVLVRDGNRFCAFSGTCPHHDAPLADGLVVDGTLRCPWHHARFSLATGEAVAAPALDPLTRYVVEQRDGRLFVTGKDESETAAATTPSSPPERIVIVGSGAAGHACAEMLTRHGFGAHVIVVGDETDRPYDRTTCSKDYLCGDVERDDCFVVDEDFYGEDGPVLRRGRKAATIDVTGKTLVLDGGERVPFDALVIATGAAPIQPELPGFHGPSVFRLRTLADTDALIAAAQAGKRGVVVGASFIGLEVAASLRKRDVEVDVVAPDDIPLKKVVGADVGALIRRVHEEQGVRFHLGREAKAYDGTRLTLDDDSTLDADFVVVGVGVKPRTTLAESGGLEVATDDDGGGIVVDEHLRTSVPDVYAIGDVARYPDRYAGRPIRVEHWVHAQRQGQFVARHLMGLAERFDDLPFFWSAHFDTGLVYSGHVGTIADLQVDGSIDDADFTVRLTGNDADHAVLNCNRDRVALAAEAAGETGREPSRSPVS